jgi:hypothetical protein
MNNYLRPYLGIIFLVLISLNGCSSALKTTEVWMDETYTGSQITKVLVVGVAEKITFRTLFEGHFAEQLAEKGIEAIPSYTVMQPHETLSKATVLPLVEKLGIDTVIVTSLIDRKKKTVYYQVDSGNLYTYYRGVRGISVANRYGSTASYDVPILVLKTNLYDVGTEKLFWSVTSESEYRYNMKSLDSAIDFVINTLAEDDLI